jgi:tRNA threonylcarbamoyladenosine biosynthesis protein TsaB
MGNEAPQRRRERGILGLDTATADAVVAVTIDGEPVAERRADADASGRPRHVAMLLAEVEAAARAAGGWERVDRLAVGVGPGAFTGLRVGVATARALAQARRLPLVGVGSLDALAAGIGERAGDRPRLALIDARRSEVFGTLHDRTGERVWEPFVASPQKLAERFAHAAHSALAGGDGSLRFRAELESAGVEVLPDADEAHRIAARYVCELAAALEPGPANDVRPIYLRRPDAEVWREQRNRDSTHG